MKKNNKKLFIIIGVIAIVLVIGILLLINSNRNSTELSLSEKKWIEDNNKNKKYPKIHGVQEISCTSPGYILQKTETTAIYIIQMRCEYYEN